ncbi:type VII secretion-associated serine protease [Actinoplanes cyaneus]|uniref:Type VII secretion-associated serine protease n=1 Tax=Actinoplanes cyaneus TaxID=52696 RepID=A0A919IL38_9ACTN|nr:type VII secretion-associated serine protease mycosin [Actinoplanes cyaneus]GID66332.1 type VII secretion-associated serine protease [Actinoplanes cyaneus]
MHDFAKNITINAALSLSFTLTPTALIERRDSIRTAEWFLDFLQIGQAHALSTGSGVIIGLPDTGTFPHRDISDNVAGGPDLISGLGNQTNNDRDGHGTEMAGLIVGHGHGRNEGILGVAPAATLIPIKVTEGGASISKLGEGIKLAATLGAKVINVSAVTGPSESLHEAINAAAQRDAIVIAGAGNNFSTSQMGYPALLPGVLAVGAVDRSGKHASFSITGSSVAICAPGAEIPTTEISNKYSKVVGTSASTAIVSGAAALVRAKFPGLSAQEVIHRLTATATDIGAPGRDEQCGYGVLNIVKALTADVPPLSGAGSPGAGDSSSAVADGTHGGRGGWRFGLLAGVAVVLTGGVLLAFLAVRRRNRKRA